MSSYSSYLSTVLLLVNLSLSSQLVTHPVTDLLSWSVTVSEWVTESEWFASTQLFNESLKVLSLTHSRTPHSLTPPTHSLTGS